MSIDSRLPVAPEKVAGMTHEESLAEAWRITWDWCVKNGLDHHSFERQDVYVELNGPQMIAQWVLDMQAEIEMWRGLHEAIMPSA